MSIWFVKGMPDDGYVKSQIGQDGNIYYSTGGSINARWALESFFDTTQVIVPGPVPTDDIPDLIVNEISSPETHSKALSICADICDHYTCGVFNDPRMIGETYRDTVASKLGGISGLIVPATIRCHPSSPEEVAKIVQDHDLGDTVIMRETGKHGGQTLVRVTLPRDLSELNRFAFDGREFYISRYVEYRSPDEHYRKYRFACVQDEVIPRHLLVTDNWMVHADARPAMEARSDFIAEEKRMYDGFDRDIKPTLGPVVRAMRQSLQLDYFCIDCHINRDGSVLLFEANANMNALINTRADKASAQPYIDRIVECLKSAITAKLGRPKG